MSHIRHYMEETLVYPSLKGDRSPLVQGQERV